MGDDRALERRGRKSGCRRGDTEHEGKCDRPTSAQDGRHHGASEHEERRPWRRLAIGGEVDRDPTPEGDGKPGDETAWTGFDRGPLLDLLRDPAREFAKAGRPSQCRPARGCILPRTDARPPCLGPSARSALFDHRAAPSRLFNSSLCPSCYTSRAYRAPAVSDCAWDNARRAQGPFAPCTLAQVSRRPTVRLNTKRSGPESASR
jgi:hypothetical protein